MDMETINYAIRVLDVRRKEILEVKRDIHAITLEDNLIEIESRDSLLLMEKKLKDLEEAINLLTSKELY